jgi:hypothetical protein
MSWISDAVGHDFIIITIYLDLTGYKNRKQPPKDVCSMPMNSEVMSDPVIRNVCCLSQDKIAT